MTATFIRKIFCLITSLLKHMKLIICVTAVSQIQVEQFIYLYIIAISYTFSCYTNKLYKFQ